MFVFDRTPDSSSPQRIEAALLAYPVISFRWAERQIPISGSTHVRGFAAIEPQRAAVPFESGLEHEAILALARLPGIITIIGQPLTVRFRRCGRTLRYTPDLLVHVIAFPRVLSALGFGEVTLIEVKPDR